MLKMWEKFADVRVRTEGEVTVSYRTANLVFEEGLRDGMWVALSYNAAGYMMDANPLPTPYMDFGQFSRPQSFQLNVDGQDLVSHWEYEGVQIDRDEDQVRCAVSLRHTIRPVRVKLHTLLDGTPVMERHIEVENLSDRAAAVSSLSVMSGGLQTARVASCPEDVVYRLGYFDGCHWADEGDFHWKDLEAGETVVGARFRRDRHRHPMFLLENRVTGEMFVGQLGFSGGYAFSFDYQRDRGVPECIAFDARVDAYAPLRVLEAGASFQSPSMHLGCVFGGLDMAVNAMHEHIRQSVMLPPTRGVTGWIETGIGPEYDMSRESTLYAIDLAAAYGSEIFFIDAAWYAPPKQEGEWWNLSGNWRYDPDRYPMGISEIREAAHKKGLLFGMWMDAERVGPGSRVWKEREDMLAVQYTGKKNPSGLLDHTSDAVCDWMKDNIEFLINEYGIDMFRLDHNVGAREGLNAVCRDGYLENTWLRYYEHVYAMYDELRAEHPEVIFENCAGGGGRTDLGMVGRFSHTWVTDYQLHPNSLRITNGMTMALPPECVDRLVGGQNAYLTGDFDLQMRNLLFARATIGGILSQGSRPNPNQMERIRKYTDLYKTFVRPMHKNMWSFHHTPELRKGAAQGFAALELAARDASRGMLGVFQLASPLKDECVVYPRGADPAKTYQVTFDNDGSTVILSGFDMVRQGFRVRLEGPLTSELILYQET